MGIGAGAAAVAALSLSALAVAFAASTAVGGAGDMPGFEYVGMAACFLGDALLLNPTALGVPTAGRCCEGLTPRGGSGGGPCGC